MNTDSVRSAANGRLVEFYKKLFIAWPRWAVGPLVAVSLSHGFSIDDVYTTLTALTRDGWFGRDGEWYVASEQFSRNEHRVAEQKEIAKLRQERDAAVTARDKALGERNELLVRAEGAEEKVTELENVLNEYRSAVRRSLEVFTVDYDTAIEIANEFHQVVCG